MADGGNQNSFRFPAPSTQQCYLRPDEIIVDLFAGGGGASEALREALGRDPDICINHDATAIGMHAANHPFARHLKSDVWHADPRREVAGKAVGWLHASPDCTHFSQAKGGQPRSSESRSLSWVVCKWAGMVKPRLISLENVTQVQSWGPLVAKRCAETGRVIKIDGSVAAPGERVPVREQYLIPDPKRAGATWKQFVRHLKRLGYDVEHRALRACDFGAGTSRNRLFMMARSDGDAIQWPEPSHGPKGRAPYVSAADCIDFAIPCPSIFQRKRPLAEATLRRIARGIKRFVLDAAEPFIVPNNTNNTPKSVAEPLPTVTTCSGRNLLVAPTLVQCANASSEGVARAETPLGVITAKPKGGTHALSSAVLVQAGHGEGSGKTQRRSIGSTDVRGSMGTVTASGGGGQSLASVALAKIRGDSCGARVTEPLPTITSGAGAKRPAGAAHAMGVITAYIEQANGGPRNKNISGHAAHEPLSTITQAGSQQRLVTAHAVERPMTNAQTPGDATGLTPEQEEGALRVAAFLMRYYGEGGQWNHLREPAATITTKERLALVTVTVRGMPFVIVDIGLRMLKPTELYRAQGFREDYVIDRTADGRRLTISESVRLVGNSVSPPPMVALIRANLPVAETRQAKRAA